MEGIAQSVLSFGETEIVVLLVFWIIKLAVIVTQRFLAVIKNY